MDKQSLWRDQFKLLKLYNIYPLVEVIKRPYNIQWLNQTMHSWLKWFNQTKCIASLNGLTAHSTQSTQSTLTDSRSSNSQTSNNRKTAKNAEFTFNGYSS